MSRHRAMERQPSAAMAGSTVSSSASGLSMPAAVKPAAVGTSESSAWLRNTGPGPRATSNTLTRCPARDSCHASKRPSRPAPAMPMERDWVDDMMKVAPILLGMIRLFDSSVRRMQG